MLNRLFKCISSILFQYDPCLSWVRPSCRYKQINIYFFHIQHNEIQNFDIWHTFLIIPKVLVFKILVRILNICLTLEYTLLFVAIIAAVVRLFFALPCHQFQFIFYFHFWPHFSWVCVYFLYVLHCFSYFVLSPLLKNKQSNSLFQS